MMFLILQLDTLDGLLLSGATATVLATPTTPGPGPGGGHRWVSAFFLNIDLFLKSSFRWYFKAIPIEIVFGGLDRP